MAGRRAIACQAKALREGVDGALAQRQGVMIANETALTWRGRRHARCCDEFL
jgi:hypothetical protein